MIYQLIYCSQKSDSVTLEDIQQIVASAIQSNEVSSITGVLFAHRNYFLQCLEGSQNAINELYAKILLDKRHSKVYLLSYKDVPFRSFPSWSMGWLSEKKVNRVILGKYLPTSEFNPYLLDPNGANLLLQELSETVNLYKFTEKAAANG